MTLILAGDIGGTKCNLVLCREEGTTLRPVFRRKLATRDYPGFESLVTDFQRQAAASPDPAAHGKLDAAGFGVAGVVVDGRLTAENLPWVLDIAALTRALDLKRLLLLNDLMATALSLDKLAPGDFVVLNQGSPVANGTRGVIAAGTGLGEAILFWNGQRYQVAQAEGGHTDFAPRTEQQIELLRYLLPRLPYVTWEEVVSGRGFRRIHEFLDSSVRHESFDGGDVASEIARRGSDRSCPVCVDTLELWTEMYGTVTGIFALQALALGGVYIAGGIAPKLLPLLKEPAFFRAFCGKSKLASVLAQVPLSVVLNEDAPLWGAAYQTLAEL